MFEDQRADRRDGDECQWYSRYGSCLAREHQYSDDGIKKKEPELEQVNHAVLRLLNPEQVEVEICRSEELDQRRGLTSELDEMWSFVRRKGAFLSERRIVD
jgi:hypothetical protein